MIRFCIVSTALIFGTLLCAQTKSAPSKAADEETSLARVSNSFMLLVKATYADTATLFGPSGERVWAGDDWDPKFLYPRPERDVEGAVFTVQHGSHRSVWVNSVRDIEARHFQYVYFIADALVTVIDVRFTPVDAAATKVDVTYTRTALNPDANGHVHSLGEQDSASAPEWQAAIDRYLQGKVPPR
jgi:hypothetical protein